MKNSYETQNCFKKTKITKFIPKSEVNKSSKVNKCFNI